MATIQEELVTLLAGTAPTFPFIANQAQAGNYITYHRVSSAPANVVTSQVPSINQTRFQIDAYSDTAQGADTLSRAVIAAMGGWARQNVMVLQHDAYVQDRKKYLVSMDYSVWHYN